MRMSLCIGIKAMDVAPTKKLLIVCSLAVGIVIVLGCVMPILATPSNCGGNSAALNKCRNYGLSVRIQAEENGGVFDPTALGDLTGFIPAKDLVGASAPVTPAADLK